MHAVFTVLPKGRFAVATPYSPLLVERFRCIPGREWDGSVNSFPLVKDVLLMVTDACGVLPWMLGDEFREVAGLNGEQALEKVALDLSVLDGHVFVTPPYRHQRSNLVRALTNEKWLFADEQGTGKSFVVANLLKSLLPGSAAFRCLILCPKSVIDGWKKQLWEHGRIGSWSLDERQPWERNPSSVKIANYEMLLGKCQERFLEINWDLIVLDEIHRLKSFTSKTSRIVRRLAEKCPRIYGLSGTPAPNGLEDWHGVLSAIDPTILECDTKTAFEARYVVRGRIEDTNIWKIVGYRNVEELHRKIGRVTSRVTKKEALDLPEKVYSTRTVRLEGEQARVYRELKKEAVARLKTAWSKTRHAAVDAGLRERTGYGLEVLSGMPPANEEEQLTIRNVLTESLRLLQVIGGFVPDDAGTVHELPDKAKLTALAEVLEEVGSKQVVVWCAFVEEAGWLAQWLAEGYDSRVSLFTGRISSGTVRQETLDKFRDGHTRFFVATAATGGTGINGLEVADTEIYYSRNWNLADYLQSQDRLHRIGQHRPVSIIKIVAADTVDQRVDEALERKAALQDMLLQDPEKVL